MLFNISVQYENGHLKDIDLWPSLIKNRDDKELIHWTLATQEYYLSKYLAEISEISWEKWRAHGLKLLADYCVDYADERKFVEAMVYLMGSDPEITNKVREWMEHNGYDFGESIGIS